MASANYKYGIIMVVVLVIVAIIVYSIKKDDPRLQENFSFANDDTFELYNGVGYQGYEGYEDKGYNENEENEIVENFPQPAPMNVMYSDANGNLATTTDLGLQNLTIAKDGALLIGNKFRFNASKDFYDDDKWLRMSNVENTAYAGNGTGKEFGGFAAQNLYAADNIYAQTANIRGNSTVSGDAVVGGKLSINGWGNVKDTLSDIYALIKTLEGRVTGHDTSISSLSSRAGELERRVTGHDTSISNLSTTISGMDSKYVMNNKEYRLEEGGGRRMVIVQLSPN